MPKQKHLAAVDTALSNALSIEMSRRKLKSNTIDDDTPDLFEQEVERVAADKYPGDSNGFNRSLIDCSKDYPGPFQAYKKAVQKHFDDITLQQKFTDEAAEFASVTKHIAYTSELHNIAFNEALELVRSEEPHVAAIYDVGHKAAIDQKYSKNTGGN